MRFRAQKVLMAAAFLCYAEALAAFALHAAEIAGGAPAFFQCLLRFAVGHDALCHGRYAGQCLAVFALDADRQLARNGGILQRRAAD